MLLAIITAMVGFDTVGSIKCQVSSHVHVDLLNGILTSYDHKAWVTALLVSPSRVFCLRTQRACPLSHQVFSYIAIAASTLLIVVRTYVFHVL
jgi:hypothetical protein